MITLREAIAQKKIELSVPEKNHIQSQRAFITSQLYPIYVQHHKLWLWKRYRKWLMDNKKKNSATTIQEYKELLNKNRWNTWNIKTFCIQTSHIKTDDFHYLLSVAKDMDNRNNNFASWLHFSIKPEKELVEF